MEQCHEMSAHHEQCQKGIEVESGRAATCHHDAVSEEGNGVVISSVLDGLVRECHSVASDVQADPEAVDPTISEVRE